VSLRRLRWRRHAKWLPFYVMCAIGCLATVKAIMHPVTPPPAPRPTVVHQDHAGQALAERFATAYLSYDANQSDQRDLALAAITGDQSSQTDAFRAPERGSQQVTSAQVVQDQPAGRDTHTYTVAAATRPIGTVYLAVTVQRTARGLLRVDGDPAIVGAPATAPARPLDTAQLDQVTDPKVKQTLTRALTNYLLAAKTNLAADLAPDAAVALPASPLHLDSIAGMWWLGAAHDAVDVSVVAHDRQGAGFPMTYRIAVTDSAGRWLVKRIQSDPLSP
jgi:hypothetical protein